MLDEFGDEDDDLHRGGDDLPFFPFVAWATAAAILGAAIVLIFAKC
jgi:hypothetical protein